MTLQTSTEPYKMAESTHECRHLASMELRACSALWQRTVKGICILEDHNQGLHVLNQVDDKADMHWGRYAGDQQFPAAITHD